jgi:hypothetical protein
MSAKGVHFGGGKGKNKWTIYFVNFIFGGTEVRSFYC